MSVGEVRRRNDHTEQRAKFYDLLRARSGRRDMVVHVVVLRQRQRRAYAVDARSFSKAAQAVMNIELTGFWKEEEERTVIDQYALAFGVPKEELRNEREEAESQ